MVTQSAPQIIASVQLSPEDQLEIIRARNGSTALMRLHGKKTFYGRQFKIGSDIYVPADEHSGVPPGMVLASDISDCGSLETLATEITDMVCSFTGVDSEVAELGARLAISTHFAEWLGVKVRLVLSGSDEVQPLRFMQVIAPFTRHSVPLAIFGRDFLSCLAAGCTPTFYISDPSLPGEQVRLMSATQYSGFGVVRNRRVTSNPFSAVILDPHNPKLHLPGTFTILDVTPQLRFTPPADCELLNLAQKYQPRLLACRMKNWLRISRSAVKPSGVGGPFAVASSVAAVFEDLASQNRVFELFKPQGELRHLEVLSSKANVVLDALLVACHQGKSAVYVGEITEKVNGNLQLQGESYRLKPRGVGPVIRSFQLPTEPRDSQGCKLVLTRAVKQKIHELGRSHDVMFFQQPGIHPCEFCRPTSPMP